MYFCKMLKSQLRKQKLIKHNINMKKTILMATILAMMGVPMDASDFGKEVKWDKHSLIIDGKRVCPVMGEVHYSRIPANEWEREIKKMKEGGVTILATYIRAGRNLPLG